MKQKTLKTLLVCLLVFAGMGKSFAHDIEFANPDGITIYCNYINNQTELEVTYKGASTNNKDYEGSVVIPALVAYDGKTYPITSIGNNAFNMCQTLTEVKIPNGVTTINERAFYQCIYLTEVNIPNSVNYIGDNAFAGCQTLTELAIPNSVISIGNFAFYQCSRMTEVTIPNSVMSIGTNPFRSCYSLEKILVESGNPNYDSRDNCNAIIQKDGGVLIAGCKTTQIPNSITTIGEQAFYDCRDLKDVVIPTNITTIEKYAYYYCRGLTEVTIPSNVTSIGVNPFAYCGNLEKVVVESGNPNYDSRDNCNAIIQKDGNVLITSCKTTQIPNNIMAIGDCAFERRTDLTEVTIPDGVISIGNGAFSQCSSLIKVTIPNSVTFIDNNAFAWCSKLAEVTIPSNVTFIGYMAFAGCGLIELTIPNSVTSIGEYAFQSCSNLTSVTIGNSVGSIGYGAFSSCSKLATIYSLNTTPPSIDNPYNNTFVKSIYETADVYVPQQALADYKTADVWKEFKKLQGFDDGGTGIAQPKQEMMDVNIPVYNLSGQKVTDTTKKGIYIVGGKKVVIK